MTSLSWVSITDSRHQLSLIKTSPPSPIVDRRRGAVLIRLVTQYAIIHGVEKCANFEAPKIKGLVFSKMIDKD